MEGFLTKLRHDGYYNVPEFVCETNVNASNITRFPQYTLQNSSLLKRMEVRNMKYSLW